MLSRDNLHNYQRKAANFIIEKKRCQLWLDMGLGKSVTTLTAITDLLDSFSVSRVLVIAPLRVANSVWKQEARNWTHLNHLVVSVCTGSEKSRMQALQAQADVYVINRCLLYTSDAADD
jgi:SNF2 family DNA or RNA helicase